MKQQTATLGKTTGNIINYCMGNNNTEPKVGKGATILSWTDRYAYEVLSISKDKKTVYIQKYLIKPTDKNISLNESQNYEYQELCDHSEKIVWRNNAWRREIIDIIFEEGYLDECNRLGKNWDEKFDQYMNDEGYLILVEGITKIKKRYPKVNIVWGAKDTYYDYSF